MKKYDFLDKVESYYKEGLRCLKEDDDIGKACFYQLLINQELSQFHKDKRLNTFSYNSCKKKYTIIQRKK